MRHGSLFSGIGGFDLAAEWMGWTNVFHVERDPFCQRVLAHHFPGSQAFSDVKTFDGRPFRGHVDILTGGFPCQPYSSAGKRLGKDDERHLWPEMCRIILEVAPAYVVGENVRGLLNWNGGVVFEEVCADLEYLGYEVWTGILPAAGVGAPHRRDRIWWVASYANGNQRPQGRVHEARPNKAKRHAGSRDARPNPWENFSSQSPLCSGNDGLPRQLDGVTFPKWRNESLKAYGNAIVPQLAFQLFRAIECAKQ
jgi:DNA (cytosine-5)-methyltransferase 1